MKFKDLLNEEFVVPKNIKFNKWIKPSTKALKLEYKVEYLNHIQPYYGDIWPTFKDFETAVKKGKVVDPNSLNVGGTTSYNDLNGLFNLIKGYRSYPEFRNEKTFQRMIDGFKNNKPMDMSLILKDGNSYNIMSGNTRLNMANILKVKPKAIVVEI